MPLKEKKISPDPLFQRLGAKRGAAAAFAKKLGIGDQVLNNWKRRGIPAHELPRVSTALGLTSEAYLREAGRAVDHLVRQDGAQYTIEAAALIEDFNALPAWLQEHIARKTAELRKYADSLPPMVREHMKAPPKDPERYRAWEKQIQDDIVARGIKTEGD